MRLKYPVIAALVTMLSLSACGGGSSDNSSASSTSGSTTTVAADNPASASQTDTTVGTGTQAASGNVVGVRYTAWLYSASASDHKGTQIDTDASAVAPLVFVVGGGTVISGLDAGVAGMKVGGERVLIIPASAAYGTTGYGAVPANSGLVYDVKLTDVQGAVADAPVFSFTDTVVGTGATAAASTTASVRYSAYLYNAATADHKGILVDSNASSTSTFAFVLGASQAISGFDQGVTGMKVGGKRTVYVPYSMAYGTSGSGSVPGYSGMVFDIQLVADQ